MRSKSIVLLALALGCGLIASIGISQVMEKRNGVVVAQGETEKILVAKANINENDLITPEMINVEEWPKAKIRPGTVTKLEELAEKRARQPMFAGEPITAEKLIGADEISSGDSKIPKGYRVVAVRVDSVSGASGLILPGTRVDLLVYLAKNPGLNIQESTTKTILQDVKVFSVDTAFTRDHDSGEQAMAAKTIGLLVTPQQAEKVMLATEMGSVRLILRNMDDNTPVTTAGVKVSDVFGLGADPNAAPTAAAQPTPAVAEAPDPNAKSLLDLINEQKSKQVAAAPVEAAPWKMRVMSGADISEVEIAPGGVATLVAEASNEPAPAEDPQATEPPAEGTTNPLEGLPSSPPTSDAGGPPSLDGPRVQLTE